MGNKNYCRKIYDRRNANNVVKPYRYPDHAGYRRVHVSFFERSQYILLIGFLNEEKLQGKYCIPNLYALQAFYSNHRL